MLNNGNDRVTPSQAMWPLLCNEVSLSYDQEERVRGFQRTLLPQKESWVDRHTAKALQGTLDASKEAMQALFLRLGQREQGSHSVLLPEQVSRLHQWNVYNRQRVAQVKETLPKFSTPQDYQIRDDEHVATNLYVLQHRLSSVLNDIPPAAPLVTGLALKKLSRRPSFESLGFLSGEESVRPLSRNDSFASSGSLKRTASEMTMEDESLCSGQKPVIPPINPVDAEMAARPYVDQVLASVQPLLPETVFPTSVGIAPVPFTTAHLISSYSAPALPIIPEPTPVASLQQAYSSAMASLEPVSKHSRQSSFLPAHLNVVPEELWPVDDTTTDEFLMSLVDEDWAIGEGVDMEY
jgi:hypothetical protein